jgi:hypothetical protein
VLEGILLFIFFFISCYLIDSYLNINARKSQKLSRALNIFSRNTFFGILTGHIFITILLASHLSFIWVDDRYDRVSHSDLAGKNKFVVKLARKFQRLQFIFQYECFNDLGGYGIIANDIGLFHYK